MKAVEPIGIINHQSIGWAVTKSQIFFKNAFDAVFVNFDILIRQ